MEEYVLSSDLLRGNVDTIVLAILEKSDSYGFEIYNNILMKTGGEYEIKEVTLYSTYRRLEKDGYVISYWGDESQGARRRYYHITDIGRMVLASKRKKWELAKKILTMLMEE
ncbi:MAG: PadR family transcriptional regulator [Rickettsiales bacterium]|jgi:DNA-binding PadR family transcriptional regulator|nr:PadR family transcriptional regulator [Rickettsiales bacterium]